RPGRRPHAQCGDKGLRSRLDSWRKHAPRRAGLLANQPLEPGRCSFACCGEESVAALPRRGAEMTWPSHREANPVLAARRRGAGRVAGPIAKPEQGFSILLPLDTPGAMFLPNDPRTHPDKSRKSL